MKSAHQLKSNYLLKSVLQWLVVAALCLISTFVLASDMNKPTGNLPQGIDKVLQKLVKEKQQSNQLPGLGAIVTQHGKILGAAISGERKKGSGILLDVNDRWHIGSITKSITATVLARLVERQVLDWDIPLKTLLGEFDMHPQWQDITLEHLLTHTSGAKPNFPFAMHFKKPKEGAQRMAARVDAVKQLLKKAPQTAPAGKTFIYSNVGYTLAGVIAELKTGMAWEDLVRQEVFGPLGLQYSGFGTPQDKHGKVTQPWGHLNIFGFSRSSKDDNTPIIGPAGTIHMSLRDAALYANEHLKGMRGHSTYLKKETFEHLHTPRLNAYAYGWVIGAPHEVMMEPIHWHNGSNTMWYALFAILPELDATVIVTSNSGDITRAEKAAWEVVQQLEQPLITAVKGPIK